LTENTPLKKTDDFLCNFVMEPLLVISRAGKVIAFNKAFTEILGVEESSIKERDFREIEELSSFWPSVQHCLNTCEDIKDRLRIGEVEYEVTVHPTTSTDGREILSLLFYDVSQYLTVEKELVKRNRELMVINTLSGAFISSYDIDRVFNDLLEKVLMITDFSVGWIMLTDNSGLILKSHAGVSLNFLKQLNEGKLDEFVWSILDAAEPLYILEKDQVKNFHHIKKEGVVFLGAIPLKVSNSISGMLFLASRSERVFDFDLASMMALVGNQISLIVEKIKLFEETRRLSITDDLTGLYNVRFFYRSLESELARARRYKDVFCLVIFDIDDFKVINDTYGHQVGDDILREVAEIILNSARKTDVVARYGGEEFVIILPRTSKTEALLLADRIRERVEENVFNKNNTVKIHITVSGGISGFPEDGKSAKDLLYTADMALYRAKGSGKKQVVCHSDKPS
jgi:diguanylate cyclase (GGDEF)-like protein